MFILLVCGGCAQSGKGSQNASTANKLQNLETSFAQFQEQERKAEAERQARDADIENKLRDIATRLGIAPSGQAKPGVPLSASVAVGRTNSSRKGSAERLPQPVVAGQIIPLSQVSPSAMLQPSAGASLQPAPVQPMSPVPAAPVNPGALPPATAVPPSPALPAIRPPVVTLGLDAVAPKPVSSAVAPGAPRAPVPLAAPARRGSQESRSPKAVESASAPAVVPAPTPAAPAAAAARITEEEGQAYVDAMRAVTANKNEEGRRKLNDFMAKYPDSAKAPEAQFWIGESYMNDKGYNQAILAFKDVVNRFPKNPKAAESLFRIADAYEKLGDKNNAAFNLKMLVEEHPSSDWAGKAKLKLKQLGQ